MFGRKKQYQAILSPAAQDRLDDAGYWRREISRIPGTPAEILAANGPRQSMLSWIAIAMGRPLRAMAVALTAITMVIAVGTAHNATASEPTKPPPWSGFQIIMWQQQTLPGYDSLRTLGVTAAKVPADRRGETAKGIADKIEPIVEAGLGSYVENITTDFYSAYHRYFPNRPVNWRFLAVKQRHATNPSDNSVFIRQPSLSDPLWLTHIRQRLRNSVRSYAAYRPLFFNLADETGIADLTAFWDFDWSPASLAGFRAWLETQYTSLPALNAEWGTAFARWENVLPENTTAAMQRTDGNYARWSDFKAWMDVAFSRAIRTGTDAIHDGGGWARAAIEGVQIPGWGGYDYSHLAGTVDVMEVINDDVSIALMRSLNPRLTILTTSFGDRPMELHQLWNAVLHGSRGLVLWDENDEFFDAKGGLGPRAQAMATDFEELRHGVGSLLTASEPRYDPIAILYSPASFRMQWMQDQRAHGEAWTQRQADTEDEDNAIRIATRDALAALERQGFTPRFVTDDEIASGLLQRAQYRLLILPHVLALSSSAARQIGRFRNNEGRLAIIGEAGIFDSHGRPLAKPYMVGPLMPDDERTDPHPRRRRPRPSQWPIAAGRRSESDGAGATGRQCRSHTGRHPPLSFPSGLLNAARTAARANDRYHCARACLCRPLVAEANFCLQPAYTSVSRKGLPHSRHRWRRYTYRDRVGSEAVRSALHAER